MNAATTPKPASALPQTPASDVKKLGWRGVMDTVRREGKVLVTNHGRPEAVVLSPEEYDRLSKASQSLEEQNRAKLDELRAQWDKKLQWLNEPGASDTLREVLRKPLQLHGKVIAGEY